MFGFLITEQVILRYKYLNSDITPVEKFDAWYYEEYKLPPVKHVRIEGIADCQVYTAPSGKLLLEKRAQHYADYTIAGDTVILKNYIAAQHDANYKLTHSPQEIILYVPAGCDITVKNSTISLKGDTISSKAVAYHITLDYSEVYTRSYSYRDTVNRYFDTMLITATNKSGVLLDKNDFFTGVDVQLQNSFINDLKAKIGNIHVLADSNSTVVVNGNNITKLNPAGIRK